MSIKVANAQNNPMKLDSRAIQLLLKMQAEKSAWDGDGKSLSEFVAGLHRLENMLSEKHRARRFCVEFWSRFWWDLLFYAMAKPDNIDMIRDILKYKSGSKSCNDATFWKGVQWQSVVEYAFANKSLQLLDDLLLRECVGSKLEWRTLAAQQVSKLQKKRGDEEGMREFLEAVLQCPFLSSKR